MTFTRIDTDVAARYGKLVSVCIPCSEIDPLAFLNHAKGQTRFLWSSPDNMHVIAGFGTAVELVAWGPNRIDDIKAQADSLYSYLQQQDRILPTPKLFGGFAFHDEFTPENAWASFAPAQFVLPHYQLEITEDGSFLSIHAELQGDDLSEEDLKEALVARYELLKLEQAEYFTQEPPENTVLTTKNLMTETEWADAIHSAQEIMQTQKLKKVVLARMKEARFEQDISSLSALEYLNEHYGDCYRFMFEPRVGHVFIGATPERLIASKDTKAKSMSLAGSIQRGADEFEDIAYAEHLLNDPKEVYEHGLVTEQVRERLNTFGKVGPAETEVLKLNNIQHLHTQVEVELNEAVGVLPMLKALHPTPAMGGEPYEVAQELIIDLEALPRGWYASPIGYMDENLDGAFAVGIRSAVLQDKRAWLYSGAGIVSASVPEKEWQETELKFKPMMRALGIEQTGIEHTDIEAHTDVDVEAIDEAIDDFIEGMYD